MEDRDRSVHSENLPKEDMERCKTVESHGKSLAWSSRR